MCTDMGNGTLCSCKDGYHLFGGQFCIGKLSHIIEHAANCTIYVYSNIIITDINECLTSNGGCSHNCTNTVGSYYCECPGGYVLQPNKLNCLEGELSLQQALTCIFLFV